VALRVESCTVVFLAWHFLFTSSDTSAVGCICCHQKIKLIDHIEIIQRKSIKSLLVGALPPFLFLRASAAADLSVCEDSAAAGRCVLLCMCIQYALLLMLVMVVEVAAAVLVIIHRRWVYVYQL